MDKYKIEKNTVQETLVIPLYGRRLCSRMFPTLFQDESAAELMERIDYDFSELEKQSNSLMQVFGALEVAMRQSDLAWEVGDYLKAHPKAAVINLGCGLDNTGRACDNGSCKIYNIDLPDVIALRNQLLPAGEREQNLALDLNDPAWMDAIDADPMEGTVLFAAGVFYYFTTKQVKWLVTSMAERFPGGRLVFDGAGKSRRQTDAQNLGETGGDQGYWRILLRKRRQRGAGALVAAALRFQPRVHAGIPEAGGAGGKTHSPPSG